MAAFEIKTDPSEDDRKAILDPLLAFNSSKVSREDYKPLAILLRDDEGEIRGGLFAKCYYDWVFVELLFVPEFMRGQRLGTELLARAEQWAKEQGCVGIWLDTFSFQAPRFYEKQGYTVFGTLERYPPDAHQRVFLRKLL
ncbi:GNAT family N-acetyltransferase [Rhizobium vallis]|uniref:GNAT family N-acetyltransferase n=1 Tax=Rhizobium vallis TaxID=634290 RepID=A0A3S0T123_9HYPH|nr:GNAT family N-acetyltransferase [Rhizobium vallis]RUM18821.1 GNAT family N-acetyltransferase [Rhizobium vallis]